MKICDFNPIMAVVERQADLSVSERAEFHTQQYLEWCGKQATLSV